MNFCNRIIDRWFPRLGMSIIFVGNANVDSIENLTEIEYDCLALTILNLEDRAILFPQVSIGDGTDDGIKETLDRVKII